MVAGYPDTPFPGKIDIQLDGTKEGDYIVIDPFVEAGNKVLAVTGNLQLYGNKIPKFTQTRLYANARKDDTTVELDIDPVANPDHGWTVGD